MYLPAEMIVTTDYGAKVANYGSRPTRNCPLSWEDVFQEMGNSDLAKFPSTSTASCILCVETS